MYNFENFVKNIFDIYFKFFNGGLYMSKILKVFFTMVTFVVGVSIGMYYGAVSKDEVEIKEEKVIDSVQDVVIKNVQNEQKKEEVEEVVAKEKRVSPYAKMIIEKKFSKCGHTTLNVLDVPKELVNLTEEDIKKKYSGWEMKDFSEDEFTLYRIIEANCDDHFVLKDEDGYIAVYAELTENIKNLVEKTEIEVNSLREEDRNDLIEGIRIYGKEELTSIIEDFNS